MFMLSMMKYFTSFITLVIKISRVKIIIVINKYLNAYNFIVHHHVINLQIVLFVVKIKNITKL